MAEIGGITRAGFVGAIKTAWIGAFAIPLMAPASVGWSLPNPPAPLPVLAASSAPLLLIRHHHHHGHRRHRQSRWPGDDEPDAPGSDQPAVSASPPDAGARPHAVPGRATRGSGSSPPAIRWVNPERSAR